jgi:hypothetical protein
MRVATRGWTLLGLLVAVVVFFFAAGATSTRVTGVNLKMWSGIVSTTGRSNITATFSGSVGSIETGLATQEFSASPGPSTVWANDASGGISNLSSTAVTFPKLTPASTGDLYLGYSATNSTASAGTTAGFRYATTSDDDVVAYNTNVSAAVQPTASQSSASVSGGLAVLITASAANAGAPPTIKAVGSLATDSGNNTTSLTTTTRQNGDLLVLTVKTSSQSVMASSVSGGGVTAWTQIAGPQRSYPDVGPGALSNILFGLCLLNLLTLIVLGAASLVRRWRSRPN